MTKNKIAIIGLGYVGLPLAIEFGKKFRVIGFDIDADRIDELNQGFDKTNEADLENLKYVIESYNKSQELGLKFSSNTVDLQECTIYIVTVPTPINQFKEPDLNPLIRATEMLGKLLKKGDIVIYESTVYPGCTEEVCVPILESCSGMKFNLEFFCGYSPERINPGDKINTLTKIRKVTSGSTSEIAQFVDALYKSVITAGTFMASSIKVAEASKAIENAQRDVNISFVNELALIFDRIGIDTTEVLEAAATKWNFLNYKPGLVGGHCIGVDPYYLTHKAQSLGYFPQVILSGRRVNENMGVFIAQKIIKALAQREANISGSRALILGITFKENCSDIRNSKVIDIYRELNSFKVEVDVFDPYANPIDVFNEYGINLIYDFGLYDIIVLAVSHQDFSFIDIKSLKRNDNSYIFDCKSFLPKNIVDGRL
jgi:UDP-N-acetyl-D-galactosamine dehydrogenase